MIKPIAAGLQRLLGNPEVFAWANELPVNSRVVDVAAAKVNSRNLANVCYVGDALSRLTMSQLQVLGLIARVESLSIQSLAKLTFMDPSIIHHQYLDPFLELGLVRRKSLYKYSATGWQSALPSRIVAIEAKLVRWQEALTQAQTNLAFANLSFVAFSSDRAPISEGKVDHFKSAGVGILGIEPTGEVRVLLRAKLFSAISADSWFQKMRVLRDVLREKDGTKWQLCH